MGRFFDIHVDGVGEPFHVHADPAEEDLFDLRQRRLLAAWRRAQFTRRGTPFRHEIARGMLDEIGPNLAELAVQNDGDLVFITFGSALVSNYKTEMTGRKASEFPGPLAKSFLSLYRLAIKTRLPYVTRYKPPAPSRVEYWHHMIAPLRGSNREVGGFLVCHVAVGR